MQWGLAAARLAAFLASSASAGSTSGSQFAAVGAALDVRGMELEVLRKKAARPANIDGLDVTRK